MGRNYSRKDTPTLSDLCLIWDEDNSDWRLTTISAISTLVEGDITPGLQEPVSQYLVAGEGFSVEVTGDDDTHLILTPAATLASGTVVLPGVADVRDKQTVLVTTSQEITSLTVDANGSLEVGAPTTLDLGGFFTMKYDSQNGTWYRVA
jgi:hypothetical protein